MGKQVKLVSTRKAMEMLHVSLATFRNMVSEHNIRIYTTATGQKRYPVEAIKALSYNTPRYGLYARVWTDRAIVVTLSEQIRDANNQIHKGTVVETYDDFPQDLAKPLAQRPCFGHLIDDWKSGKINGLVISIDSLHDINEVFWLKILERAGLNLVFVVHKT